MSRLDPPVNQTVWAALDFEGAGSAPGRRDEPVQVGMAVWRGGQEGPEDCFRSYLHTPGPITAAARAVHGIADQVVAGAPAMPLLWPEFKARLGGAVVVAHGSGTEKRFLRAFPLHGFGPWLDTLTMARALLPGLPDHALATVVGALGLEGEVREVCPHLSWHDALFDAVACLTFLRHLVATLDLGEAPVGQLQNLDQRAYLEHRGLLRAARQAGWV